MIILCYSYPHGQIQVSIENILYYLPWIGRLWLQWWPWNHVAACQPMFLLHSFSVICLPCCMPFFISGFLLFCTVNWAFLTADWRSTETSKVWGKSWEPDIQEHVPCPMADIACGRVARSLQGHLPIANKICSCWCSHICRVRVHLGLVGNSTHMKSVNIVIWFVSSLYSNSF